MADEIEKLRTELTVHRFIAAQALAVAILAHPEPERIGVLDMLSDVARNVGARSNPAKIVDKVARVQSGQFDLFTQAEIEQHLALVRQLVEEVGKLRK